MHRHVLFLAVVIGCIVCAPVRAHAEWKGYDCQGGYLVGFAARAGDYVDQIGAMCAPWDVKVQHLGAQYQGPMFAWSPGGNPQSAICPADMAVTEVDYVLPSINGIEVLERVTMKCQSVLPPYGGTSEYPRIVTAGDAMSQMPRAGSWDPGYGHPACKEGQLAVGFEANVDRYVGELKLHCEQPPTLAKAPSNLIGYEKLARDEPQPSPLQNANRAELAADADRSTARKRAVRRVSVPGSDSIGGEWRTSEGPVNFTQDGDHLEGSYPNNNGHLSLNREGDTWTGLWTQTSSGQRCHSPTRAGDNYFWGHAEFVFSNENHHFDGHWSYCGADAASGSVWTGNRVN